jgi:hypothetical protein
MQSAETSRSLKKFSHVPGIATWKSAQADGTGSDGPSGVVRPAVHLNHNVSFASARCSSISVNIGLSEYDFDLRHGPIP